MIATFEFTIGLKMLWSDIKFPPINLYSFPIQEEFIRRNAQRAVNCVSSKTKRQIALSNIGKFYKSRSKN